MRARLKEVVTLLVGGASIGILCTLIFENPVQRLGWAVLMATALGVAVDRGFVGKP